MPPSRRESPLQICDHPLWNVRRVKDAELYDKIQASYKSLKKPFDNDKAFIIDLTKHGGVAASSFVVMKFRDFQDLAIGTPAGELERESTGGPLDWAMVAAGYGHDDD